MTWPPLKAWTSKKLISGHVHFVAINYGGKCQSRWVIMMSVLDSSIVVKVSWNQLVDQSYWQCGWDENNTSKYSKLTNNKDIKRIKNNEYPSTDSGLTIPITKNIIRPWFENIEIL